MANEPYTVEYVRNMVKRGILLGPEAAQALLDEIDRLNKELKLSSEQHERTLDFVEESLDQYVEHLR